MRVLSLVLAAGLSGSLAAAAPTYDGAHLELNQKRDASTAAMRDLAAATHAYSKAAFVRFMNVDADVKDVERSMSDKQDSLLRDNIESAAHAKHDTEHGPQRPAAPAADFRGKLDGYDGDIERFPERYRFQLQGEASARVLPGNTDGHVAIGSAVDTTQAEQPAEKKKGYLSDPKNAPTILGASAVSVVASYMLGHEIKSNVETTQQLDGYAAKMAAQQQSETAQAMQATNIAPANIPAPNGQNAFRLQRRMIGGAVNMAERGTPNPAGLFLAGIMGIAFYEGASEIARQRLHDRNILERQREARYQEVSAQATK